MLTGHQILKARRLLKKTTPWLSRHSGVGYGKLITVQRMQGEAPMDAAALSVLRRVLEASGIEFFVGIDGTPDARVRHPRGGPTAKGP